LKLERLAPCGGGRSFYILILMKRPLVFFLAISIITISLFSACATSPSRATTDFSVSARIVGTDELKKAWGLTYQVNPYLEPVTLFRGQFEQFIVLELSLSLPEDKAVSIVAFAKDSDGKTIATVKSCQEMIEFTATVKSPEKGDLQLRKEIVTRSYLPGESFTGKVGTRKYLVVLMGKYPIVGAGDAVIQVFIDGRTPELVSLPFEYTAPPDAK